MHEGQRHRAPDPGPLFSAMSADGPTRLGAIVGILAIQFFIAQVIVQSAWTTPFSLSQNYISDLGNTACGPYPLGSDRYVCSPWHSWMNASFVVLGLTIIAGALLMRSAFRPGRLQAVGVALLALAGPGAVLVGLFPENGNIALHRLGAGSNFVFGNLGIALLGAGMVLTHRWPELALFSLAAGLVGLAATVDLALGLYLPGGIGTVERLAAYPIPLWLVVAGSYLLVNRRRQAELSRVP